MKAKAKFRIEHASSGSGSIFFFGVNELAKEMIDKQNGFSGGVGYRTAKECYPVLMPKRFEQFDVFKALNIE